MHDINWPQMRSSMNQYGFKHRFLCLVALSCFGLSAVAQADIYVYRNFYGRMTFSDRPIRQEGYELTKRIYTRSSNPLTTPSKRKSGGDDFVPRLTRRSLDFDSQIHTAARSYDVDPSLIKAVIHVESHFNPQATSRVGAQGLMQLMPGTADQYSVQDAFDPQENIRAGSKHLSYLLKKYNYNLDFALAAYNAGEAKVSQYGGVPPYRETQDYVRRVKQAQEQYRLAANP